MAGNFAGSTPAVDSSWTSTAPKRNSPSCRTSPLSPPFVAEQQRGTGPFHKRVGHRVLSCRIAVRFYYKDASEKQQMLYVIFNQAAAQAGFVNDLRRLGDVVGSGEPALV